MRRLGLTAITAAFLLPVSMVKADALLFPYVVTSPTVASIISVVNKDTDGRLFLEYFTKINLAHDSECTSSGRTEVGSGQNDVVSFEANGRFVGPAPASTIGGPLFNDPGSNAGYAGDDFTMGLPGTTTRAYLVVDDGDSNGEDLYGEAIILETVGGAAWGYIAFNAANDSSSSPTFDSDASSPAGVINDVHGEALDAGNNTDGAPFTALPLNEWVTRFFVTPLADGNQRLCEDCSAVVEVTRTDGGAAGMYDRDTTPLAGNDDVNVVCVSGVGLEEMLPASVEAVVAVQGGYGFIDIDTGDSTTAQGSTSDTENAATVIKLEYNKAGTQSISPSAANTFTGTVNTAVWLMNRDNAQGNDAF